MTLPEQSSLGIDDTGPVTRRPIVEVPEPALVIPDLPELIYHEERVGEVFNALENYPLVAFDCETTSLDFNRGKIHALSLATLDKEWCIMGPALPTALPQLAHMSRQTGKTWIGWNAPFDLHFLTPYGFEPRDLSDVQVAAWLVDENESMALKEQASLRLGIYHLPSFRDLQNQVKRQRKLRRLSDVNIEDIPMDILVPYAIRDARLTFSLWPILMRSLQEQGLYDRFIHTEMPFIRVLEQMERNGMALDMPHLDELHQKYQSQLDEKTQAWKELTGEVNPSSTPQLANYFYNKLGHEVREVTDKGQPKVDILALQRIARVDKTGSAKLLLSIRSLHKMLSTYLNNLKELSYEGRIYTNYSRTGTVTGRLASSDPDLQNIPIKGERGKDCRSVFIASEGWLLLVADYSQLELRILAHFSQDARLLQVFRENRDPHQMTADLLHVERRIAKTINYAISYGGTATTVCDNIEEETGVRPKFGMVKEWLDSWWSIYPGANRWMAKVVEYASRNAHVKTLGGRLRRLPEMSSPVDSIRMRAERQARNSPIQGTAADIMEDAMILAGQIVPWYGGRMLLQVHDELVIEAPPEVMPDLCVRIKSIMEGMAEKYSLRVPLIVEPHTAHSWAEAKG